MSDAAFASTALLAAPGGRSVPMLLRAEGFAAAGAAVIAYAMLGAPWWLFAALFLAPDLAMLGYLGGRRVGAHVYNAAHSYLAPAALAGIGALAHLPLLLALAAILAGHIGFDRALGYGLKFAGGFKETHLSRLGGQGSFHGQAMRAAGRQSSGSIAGL